MDSAMAKSTENLKDPTTDISFARDGSLTKKQVKEGTGWQTPKDTAKVQLLVSSVTDGCNPLPGFEPATLLFSIGNSEVADVFECAVATMRLGEQAKLTCTHPHTCREVKLGLKDVTSSTVVIILELTGLEPSKDMLDLSESERLAFAAGRKDAGAQYFRSGSYWLALIRYQKVVELFSYTDNLSQDIRAKAIELRRLCELNCAACCLKIQKFDAALTYCENILSRDRDNTKALFRRAQARLGLGLPGEAVGDLKRLVLLDQKNKDARALLKEAIARMRGEEDCKVAPLYSKMCDALGKGPIPETFWKEYRDMGDGFTHPRQEEAFIEEFRKNLAESVDTEARYKVIKEAEERLYGKDRPSEERRQYEMRLNAAIDVHSKDFHDFQAKEGQDRDALPSPQEDDATFLANKAAWPDSESDTEQ